MIMVKYGTSTLLDFLYKKKKSTLLNCNEGSIFLLAASCNFVSNGDASFYYDKS